MVEAVQFTEPGVVELVDGTVEDLTPGRVRVRTWYSGISAGTELTAYRGSNPYLTRSWDLRRRLFVDGAPSVGYPVLGWGYSEVGEVVEVADDVTEPSIGQVVYGGWGHRSDAVVDAVAVAGRQVPTGVAPVHAVFARVGAVALNAVLAAEPHLGEQVAVFGQGVIGLLAGQLVRLGGGRVIVVDGVPARRDLALGLGAHDAVPADAPGGAGAAIRDRSGAAGVDAAIELSGSYRALHEAVRCVVPGGRVIAAGFYQGEGLGLRLGEEFHHNQVQLVASQIGATPTWLGPRWNRARLVTVFMDLLADSSVEVAPLLTDVLDVDQVAAAFRALDERSADVLQVVLRFPAAPA